MLFNPLVLKIGFLQTSWSPFIHFLWNLSIIVIYYYINYQHHILCNLMAETVLSFCIPYTTEHSNIMH